MSAFEQDIRKAVNHAYSLGQRWGEVRALVSQARALMKRQMAFDQANGIDPALNLKEVAKFLRSLPLEQREMLLSLLREGESEAADEPLKTLGFSRLDDLVATESEGEKSFNAMFKDAQRIKPGDQLTGRQPRQRPLAADSAAMDTFDRMFPDSKRLN